MINEVAPPGWGHTKAEKEKTKPDKPKSKIGGSAAAFKRALDDGRFKGLPGDKTKKEKTASMFKLMWSMKKKGDKPHYKPGTDKKYKKYQEEDAKYGYDKKGRSLNPKDIKKRTKQAEDKYEPNKPAIEDWVSGHSMGPTEGYIPETLSGKDVKKLAKASALSQSDNPKDQDRARARQVEIDYKDLMDQRKKKKVGVGKSMREEKKSCPEGEYYWFDMGKCRPIPDGHKVREDGELVKEEVEIDEAKPEFEVKYAKSKAGPFKVTKFMTLDQAKEFLADVKKDGMNGIISKGGKPVKEETILERIDRKLKERKNG